MDIEQKLSPTQQLSFNLLKGWRIGGRYQVIQQAGNGNYAKVWKARDITNNQLKAVKIINFHLYQKKYKNEPQTIKYLKKAFVQQIKNLFQTNSKYVVKYQNLYSISDGKIRMIVMDYCEGPSLSTYVVDQSNIEQQQQSFISDEEALQIISHIIMGVRDLHRRGIIHRDLHPGNIIKKRENWTIIDLGFSKLIHSKYNIQKQTYCGFEMTMAPQIIKSTCKYNANADVWSIGVLLFYIVTNGKYLVQIKQKIKDKDIVLNRIKKQLQIEFMGKQSSKRNPSFLKQAKRSQKMINFLKQILVFDQHKRMNIFELASHPIFKQFGIDMDNKQQQQKLNKQLCLLSIISQRSQNQSISNQNIHKKQNDKVEMSSLISVNELNKIYNYNKSFDEQQQQIQIQYKQQPFPSIWQHYIHKDQPDLI